MLGRGDWKKIESEINRVVQHLVDRIEALEGEVEALKAPKSAKSAPKSTKDEKEVDK